MSDEKTFTLISAWENFKRVNDSRLREIDRKGYADPLFNEHLHSINTSIDQYKARLDNAEATSVGHQRPKRLDGGFEKDPCLEYGSAFRNYLRKGMDGWLEALQTKALSVGSDPDGGYLVTPSMSSKIVQAIFEASPMRQLASVEIVSTESLDLIDDHNQASAGWVSETASVIETGTPSLAKRNIPTHELYAQPKATQKLVDDATIDVEAWLSSKIAGIFSRIEDAAFISGTGVGMPRGILTYAAGMGGGQVQQVNSGSAGSLTADGLINLFYSLKEDHSKRASFLMNRMTVQEARLLKDSATGQYLWQPGLSAGSLDTLLGVPVHSAADMPVAAPLSLSVAVGDFKAAYQIVDRAGIRILRDPFTEKPFVKFYSTKRVGGDVVDFDAIKLLRLAA